MSKRRKIAPVVYVLSFGDELTKVGRTTNWASRRKGLTHYGGLKVVAEAVFHLDPEEDLSEAEQMALAGVCEHHPRAGGKEWFKAPFDPVLSIVAASLSNGGVLADLVVGVGEEEQETADLSEMTGDQLDQSIREFCRNHGVVIPKVVRWLNADRHMATIKRTGFVPLELAQSMEALWERPGLLFERSAN